MDESCPVPLFAPFFSFNLYLPLINEKRAHIHGFDCMSLLFTTLNNILPDYCKALLY